MQNYFTISELIKSETAIKKKIWNGAPKEAEDNLVALRGAVLNPLREKYGKPIYISSGYRNKEVNKDVGGVTGSQHLTGEAADIYTAAGRKGNYELGRLIVKLGVYDQVIFENTDGKTLECDWVHVSYKRVGSNRGVIMFKKKGTNTYTRISISSVI